MSEWTPGERFASMLADATFQNVPAHSIMRKLMKSIKAGEFVVDLSENEDNTSPDNTETGDGNSVDTGGSGL